MFALYLALLRYLTVFSKRFGRSAWRDTTLAEYFGMRGNLVPFRTVSREIKALSAGNYPLRTFIINTLGNLAAFAPFALFMPILNRRCRKFPVFFAVTSAAIIAVEAVQLFARVGSFDVDDYILNIAGASLLFLLLTPLRRKFKTTDSVNANEKSNIV